MLRIGVLGSGSGSNMQSIVDAVAAGTLEARVVCVLSDVPGAGILERAARHGIPHQYVDPAPFKTKLEGAAEERVIGLLRDFGADTVVLAGFMRVVKPGLLHAYPRRVLNIHPALLPAFPGLAAWKQALDYGVKVAGCTVHFVDEGMDSGPIILQEAVPVEDDDTVTTLAERILHLEHRLYVRAVRLYCEGRIHISGRAVKVLPPRQNS